MRGPAILQTPAIKVVNQLQSTFLAGRSTLGLDPPASDEAGGGQSRKDLTGLFFRQGDDWQNQKIREISGPVLTDFPLRESKTIEPEHRIYTGSMDGS